MDNDILNPYEYELENERLPEEEYGIFVTNELGDLEEDPLIIFLAPNEEAADTYFTEFLLDVDNPDKYFYRKL